MRSLVLPASACALGLSLLAVVGSSGCALQKHANTNPLASVPSNQPDKVLFDRAMKDIDQGKYSVARLTLETLINAYPDSEYLARAKMGIADAWYRQGGTDGMAQAEAQYKDFITFFPTMKEASEAQLKVATIHFRQIEKSDRDPTEANRAQEELRTFLLTYPESPLHDQALQMLREVQEVLAEREDKIGQFYLLRGEVRAAQSRLEDVAAHYPLYSEGDNVLSTLANSYVDTATRYETGAKLDTVEIAKTDQILDDPKAPPNVKASAKVVGDRMRHQRDLMNQDALRDRTIAIADYTRLIERFPLSPLVANAKKQLIAMHAPVPTPTAQAIAFNREEIAGRGRRSKLDDAEGMLRSRPEAELARADKVGMPSLSNSAQNGDGPPLGGADAAMAGLIGGPVGSQGGVLTPTDTPTATYANNFGDVNATNNGSDATIAPKDDTQVLTPSELDAKEQEAITEEELERNPPQISAKAAAAILLPDPNAKPKKKSLFSKIVPIG